MEDKTTTHRANGSDSHALKEKLRPLELHPSFTDESQVLSPPWPYNIVEDESPLTPINEWANNLLEPNADLERQEHDFTGSDAKTNFDSSIGSDSRRLGRHRTVSLDGGQESGIGSDSDSASGFYVDHVGEVAALSTPSPVPDTVSSSTRYHSLSASLQETLYSSLTAEQMTELLAYLPCVESDAGFGYQSPTSDSDRTLRPAEFQRLAEQFGVSSLRFDSSDEVLSFKLEDKYAELVVPPPPSPIVHDVSKITGKPGERANVGRSNSRKLPKIPVDQTVAADVARCVERVATDSVKGNPLPVVCSKQLDIDALTLACHHRNSDQETVTDSEESKPRSRPLEPEISLNTTCSYKDSQTNEENSSVQLAKNHNSQQLERQQRSDDFPANEENLFDVSTSLHGPGRKSMTNRLDSSPPIVVKATDVCCQTGPRSCGNNYSSSINRPEAENNNNNRSGKEDNTNLRQSAAATDGVNDKTLRIDQQSGNSAFTSYSPQHQSPLKPISVIPSQNAIVAKKASRRLSFPQKTEPAETECNHDGICVPAVVCSSPTTQPTATVSGKNGTNSLTSSKLADVFFSSPYQRFDISSTVDDRSADSMLGSAEGSWSSMNCSEDGVNALGGNGTESMQNFSASNERVLRGQSPHKQPRNSHGTSLSFDSSVSSQQQHLHQPEHESADPAKVEEYARLVRKTLQQQNLLQPRHQNLQATVGLVRRQTSAKEQLGKQLPLLPLPSMSDRFRKSLVNDGDSSDLTEVPKASNKPDAPYSKLMRPASVPVPEYQQLNLSPKCELKSNSDDRTKTKKEANYALVTGTYTRRKSAGTNPFYAVNQHERCNTPSASTARSGTVVMAENLLPATAKAVCDMSTCSNDVNSTSDRKATKAKQQKGLHFNFSFIGSKRRSVQNEPLPPTSPSVTHPADHMTDRKLLSSSRQRPPSHHQKSTDSMHAEVEMTSFNAPPAPRPSSAFQPSRVTEASVVVVAPQDKGSAGRHRTSSESAAVADRRNRVTSVSSSLDGCYGVAPSATDSNYSSLSSRFMETSFAADGNGWDAINDRRTLEPSTVLRISAASEDDQYDVQRRRMPETPRTPPPYWHQEVLTPLPMRRPTFSATAASSKPPSGTGGNHKLSKSASIIGKIKRILPSSRGKSALKDGASTLTNDSMRNRNGSSTGTMDSQDGDGSQWSSLDRRSTVSFGKETDNSVCRDRSTESEDVVMNEPSLDSGGFASNLNQSPVHRGRIDASPHRQRHSGMLKFDSLLDTPSATPCKTPSGPRLSILENEFSSELSHALLNRWEKVIIEKTYAPNKAGRIDAIIDVQVLVERMSDRDHSSHDDVIAVSTSSNSLPDHNDFNDTRNTSPSSHRAQVFDDAKTKLGSATRHFVGACKLLIGAATEALSSGLGDGECNFDGVLNRTVKLFTVLIARFRYAAAIFGHHRGAQLATRMNDVSNAFLDTLVSAAEVIDSSRVGDFDEEEQAACAQLILTKTDRLAETLGQLVSTTKLIKLIKRETQTPTAFF